MFLLNQNKELDLCLKELNKNGIIVYPTDTVYGIGGDATNIEVSSRINRIKKREENQPLIFLMKKMPYDLVFKRPLRASLKNYHYGFFILSWFFLKV